MPTTNTEDKAEAVSADDALNADDTASESQHRPKEIGGRGGLDPTRYGDWEKAGRCIDF